MTVAVTGVDIACCVAFSPSGIVLVKFMSIKPSVKLSKYNTLLVVDVLKHCIIIYIILPKDFAAKLVDTY